MTAPGPGQGFPRGSRSSWLGLGRERRAGEAHSKNKHFLPWPGSKSFWGVCLSLPRLTQSEPASLPRLPCSMEQAQGLAPFPLHLLILPEFQLKLRKS